MRRAVAVAIAVVPVLVLSSCRSGVTMWEPCGPGGDPTGTDGTYVLVCSDGVWRPIMTVGEFVASQKGEPVVYSPLPVPPTPTTTTASTTTASTTTTTIPEPEILGMSSSSGPTSGGTAITITGTNLSGTTAVTFGSTPAIGFFVVDDTEISAISPAGPAGHVEVVVTTPGGSAEAPFDWTYVDAPTVTGVSPDNGSYLGGEPVVLTGTGLTGATAVHFGSSAAASFVVDSDTQITAVSPAGSVGSVDITVTTPGGTSPTSSADEFEYLP